MPMSQQKFLRNSLIKILVKDQNLEPGASNLAFDHDLDSTILAGLGRFEGLHSLLQLEPVSYEWLDVDLATCHHGDGLGVAVGIAEYSPDINFTACRVQNRNLDDGRAHAHEDDGAARAGSIDRRADAGLDAAALDGDVGSVAIE